MKEDQDNEKNQGKDNFPNEDQKENKEDNKDGVVVAENDEKLDEKEADKQVFKTFLDTKIDQISSLNFIIFESYDYLRFFFLKKRSSFYAIESGMIIFEKVGGKINWNSDVKIFRAMPIPDSRVVQTLTFQNSSQNNLGGFRLHVASYA